MGRLRQRALLGVVVCSFCFVATYVIFLPRHPGAILDADVRSQAAILENDILVRPQAAISEDDVRPQAAILEDDVRPENPPAAPALLDLGAAVNVTSDRQQREPSGYQPGHQTSDHQTSDHQTSGYQPGALYRRRTNYNLHEQAQTSDNWPIFSSPYFLGKKAPSPYRPDIELLWDFDVQAFLQNPGVKGRPPKVVTWMVKTRYTPPLPEPVPLRVCPDMPCRITTNPKYREQSAALLWAGQIMNKAAPPPRSSPDQVYIFHNHEPQKPDWIHRPSFRLPAWRSAFNWTMTYRADSDLQAVYGKVARRRWAAHKDYDAILAAKTGSAAMMASSCQSHGRRHEYVRRMRAAGLKVDVYGDCENLKCPRNKDGECFQMLSRKYKFYLSFESAFCRDYVSEKFFRFMDGDFVVVARGSPEIKLHAPAGSFIDANDFRGPEALARHLLALDAAPREYSALLQAKDTLVALYEDWPLRNAEGEIYFMAYHYHGPAFCELCRRLWDLERHRKTVADIQSWFDKGNCYAPPDLR